MYTFTSLQSLCTSVDVIGTEAVITGFSGSVISTKAKPSVNDIIANSLPEAGSVHPQESLPVDGGVAGPKSKAASNSVKVICAIRS